MNKTKESSEQAELLNPEIRKIASDLKGFFIISGSVISTIVLICISALVFASTSDISEQSTIKMTVTTFLNQKPTSVYPHSQKSQTIDANTPCYDEISSSTGPAFPTPTVFCPSKDDLLSTGGSVNIFDQGWTLTGGAGVSSKSSYNIIGGSVEYFNKVNPGVNANIYSIGATIPSTGYANFGYCDGSKSTKSEYMTGLKAMGNVYTLTTLHTIINDGPGCTAWGCGYYYKYNGQTRVTMKVSFNNYGN